MKTSKYILFITILYLFIFQFALMQIADVFKFWDELYALLSIGFWMLRLGNRKIIKKNLINKMISLILLYITLGLLSNVIYGYQKVVPVITDVLLNVKFYLGIATTYFLFKNEDLNELKQAKIHIKIIIFILFTLVIADKIWKFFPQGDPRFGINSEQLFFGHPTGLASTSFFLLTLSLFFYTDKKKDLPFIIISIFLVISTLRVKAIGATIIFIYIYLYINVFNKKLTIKSMLIPILVIAIVGWDTFYGYFLSANRFVYARGALTYTSISIAHDYFPIGAGFGTFASAPSGTYYSPLYLQYGINNVYGISQDFTAYISDTFWPMILGQTGVLGFICYIGIITCLFKIVNLSSNFNKKIYTAGMGSLLYILVSSLAESAFVNPFSLTFSVVLGLLICYLKQNKII